MNFGQSSGSATDLVNIFPFSKFYTVHLTGNSKKSYGYINFPSNEQFGTNYAVYMSTIYAYQGSGGTYDEFGFQPSYVISHRQNNGFRWNVGSGDGDNKNLYLVFMVVYSSQIPNNSKICGYSQDSSSLPNDGSGKTCS